MTTSKLFQMTCSVKFAALYGEAAKRPVAYPVGVFAPLL